MRTILLIVLALAACSTPPPAPMTTGQTVATSLQIDLAGCRALGDATYDGALWRVDLAGLRCPIALDAGEEITEWIVVGRHDTAGPQVTTAVLQRLGTEMATALHLDVNERIGSRAALPGAFLLKRRIDPPWPVGDDGVYSLLVFGDGVGDRVGAAVVRMTRP